MKERWDAAPVSQKRSFDNILIAEAKTEEYSFYEVMHMCLKTCAEWEE